MDREACLLSARSAFDPLRLFEFRLNRYSFVLENHNVTGAIAESFSTVNARKTLGMID